MFRVFLLTKSFQKEKKFTLLFGVSWSTTLFSVCLWASLRSGWVICECWNYHYNNCKNLSFNVCFIPDNPPYLAGRVPVWRGLSWFLPFSLFPPIFDYHSLFAENYPKMMIFYSDNTLFTRIFRVLVINKQSEKIISRFYVWFWR